MEKLQQMQFPPTKPGHICVKSFLINIDDILGRSNLQGQEFDKKI